jgi:SAM-dependent methyltransferase
MSIRQTLIDQYTAPSGPLGWVAAWSMPLVFRTLYRAVAKALALRADDEVLDVGCGSGAFLRSHAAEAAYVAGLDHSDIQIRIARALNRKRVAAGTAELVVGDSAALPWDDDRFSVVTSNCLSCFADQARSLQEMHRVLRPDGRVLLSLEGPADDAQSREADRWGMRSWTEDEARQMLEEAGFIDISVDTTTLADMMLVTATGSSQAGEGRTEEQGGSQ